MFANIAQLSLLSLALPTAFASSHGQMLNRRHGELAKRQIENVTLERRVSNSRWSFYNVETGNAGSCGKFHTNSDFTVAMNDEQMNSGFCFKNIKMTYNGKTTTASVTDTCPGCPYGGLDLTEGLFQFFAPSSVGIIYGDWEFVDGSGDSDPAPAPTTSKKTTPIWTPPTTSIWVAPKTTSTKPKTTATPTSTWVPPPSSTSTKKTSTTTSKTSTTSTTHSSSSTISSTSSTSSVNYSTGPAAGLAVPTGTIESQPGAAQNVANMYQAFVQVGGLIAGAANI